MGDTLATVLKTVVYRLMSALRLDIDGFPNEGIAVCGYWIRPRRGTTTATPAYRGSAALERCLSLAGLRTVLDVGSGGGEQAHAFHGAGKDVTCVDFGVSVYAQAAPAPSGTLRVIFGDFNHLALEKTYDLVWCSHALEHQRNVGMFLERLISACAPNGWVCITVPFCHRAMWGGHLTLWTPGLLAYNIALTGVDLRDAELIYGHREFSILFQSVRALLPALTYDNGDIALLSKLLPSWVGEGRDGWPYAS